MESLSLPEKHYIGFTEDLKKRIEYIIMNIKVLAKDSKFEQYLKSHSGRAFTVDHYSEYIFNFFIDNKTYSFNYKINYFMIIRG